MRINILFNLAVTVGMVFAYDGCLTKSSWNDCVSTRRDAASSTCLSIYKPSSLTTSCICTGFEINYSCVKTYCAGDTSLQSQYLDSYNSCTSFASNPFGVLTTTTAGESTLPGTEMISTTGITSSGSPVPTSTPASSSASGTSPTIGITSAPETTISVTTSQPSSTTSASDAAANIKISSNVVFGCLLVFLAMLSASIPS